MSEKKAYLTIRLPLVGKRYVEKMAAEEKRSASQMAFILLEEAIIARKLAKEQP